MENVVRSLGTPSPIVLPYAVRGPRHASFFPISGTLILLNALALLSRSFWGFWTGIIPWLPIIDSSKTHIFAFLIGTVIGIVSILGSFIKFIGYFLVGTAIVAIMALLSLVIGGGFLIGFLFGISIGFTGLG